MKNYMGELLDFIKNKKNLTNTFILGILIIGLFVGIYLIRHQQILKSRAIADPISFAGDNIVNLPDGKKGFTLNAQGKAIVKLELTSPLGPPNASASAVPTPNFSLSRPASPSSSPSHSSSPSSSPR